jgi:hypothetical protein
MAAGWRIYALGRGGCKAMPRFAIRYPAEERNSIWKSFARGEVLVPSMYTTTSGGSDLVIQAVGSSTGLWFSSKKVKRYWIVWSRSVVSRAGTETCIRPTASNERMIG